MCGTVVEPQCRPAKCSASDPHGSPSPGGLLDRGDHAHVRQALLPRRARVLAVEHTIGEVVHLGREVIDLSDQELSLLVTLLQAQPQAPVVEGRIQVDEALRTMNPVAAARRCAEAAVAVSEQ